MDDKYRLNVPPIIFGQPFWNTLYNICLSYPKENPSSETMKTFNNFFHSLRILLPCEKCRFHFGNLIKQFPVDNHLNSRKELLKWLVLVNNQVNSRLGKKNIIFSQKINNLLSNINIHKKNSDNIKLICIPILLIFLYKML